MSFADVCYWMARLFHYRPADVAEMTVHIARNLLTHREDKTETPTDFPFQGPTPSMKAPAHPTRAPSRR